MKEKGPPSVPPGRWSFSLVIPPDSYYLPPKPSKLSKVHIPRDAVFIGGLYLGYWRVATSKQSKMSTDKYLCGIHAVVLESGMGKGRAGILCRQLQAKGGTVDPSVSDSTTHLLVGNNVRRSRLPVLLGGTEVPSRVRVVRADWLSSCLAHGKRLREDEYEVPQSSLDPSPTSSPQKAAVLNSTSPSSAGRGGHSGRQEERGRDSSLVGCVGKESEGEEVAAVEDQHCVAEREEVTGVEDQHCVAEGEEVAGVNHHCVAERVSVLHNHSLHTSYLCPISTPRHYDVGTLARRERLQTQTVTMLTQVRRKRDKN